MNNSFKINNIEVGDNSPCFIIAEAGSNHNGSIDKAKLLIDIAKESGANAVKFQFFKPEKLVNSEHNAYKILEKFSFKREWIKELIEYCKDKDIVLMATPFDKEAVDLIEEYHMGSYKVASGDITYLELIRYMARKQLPMIVSTGASNIKEIKETVNTIKGENNDQVALLHCIVNYPTELENCNLKSITAMKNEFPNTIVGFSDHTLGITAPIGAVALGAKIIEKHFTFDREANGPDHSFALEPSELKEMVSKIRDLEKALGNVDKTYQESEKPALTRARRGLYINRTIKEGEVIKREDIDVVRPNVDIGAEKLDEVVGKKSKNTIEKGQPLKWSNIR